MNKFLVSITIAIMGILSMGSMAQAGEIGTPQCQPRIICGGTQSSTPVTATPYTKVVRGGGAPVSSTPRVATPPVRGGGATVAPAPRVAPKPTCVRTVRNGVGVIRCSNS